MATIFFVRHGKAAGGFDEDHDPGLDEVGTAQAKAASQSLSSMKPIPIISSPLKRCRETARPLCEIWDTEAKLVSAVAEIPSPTEDLQERTKWLRGVMAGSWSDITDPALHNWRDSVVSAIETLPQDTVVFSHFIAINVIAGHVLKDDRLIVFRPDNCSITKVSSHSGRLQNIELGREAETQVR